MIIKIKRHDNFRAVARYHDRKTKDGKSHLLFSNLFSSSPEQMVREYEAIAARNPRIKKPLAHVFISLGPEEHLNDRDFRLMVRRYVHRLGYQFSQCAAWRHSDSKHEHIHILLNQVTSDGEVVPDRFNYAKHDYLAERLEEEFGLQHTTKPADIPLHERRRKVTAAEQKNGLRTSTTVALIVHKTLDMLAPTVTFRRFADELALANVIVELHEPDLSHRHHYLLYRYQGEVFAAGQLDKASTVAGFQSRGIRFDGLISELDQQYCESQPMTTLEPAI